MNESTKVNLAELAETQRKALAAQDEGAASLASLLLDSDVDHLLVMEALRAHVPYNFWLQLADAMEVCPEHVVDAAICADDQALDCEAGIESAIASEKLERDRMIESVRELHGEETAQLILGGWTVESAIAHHEGSCNRELCQGIHPGDLCEWFARCENQAELLVPHPILGQVPSCRRCQTVVGR